MADLVQMKEEIETERTGYFQTSWARQVYYAHVQRKVNSHIG